MSGKYNKILDDTKSNVSIFNVDSEEDEALLPADTLPRSHRQCGWRFMVILTVFNISLLVMSCSLTGAWLFDNYIILNGPFRRLSSYSITIPRIILRDSFSSNV
jgi:hypothetical protein